MNDEKFYNEKFYNEKFYNEKFYDVIEKWNCEYCSGETENLSKNLFHNIRRPKRNEEACENYDNS
jgi:hypothetical protein